MHFEWDEAKRLGNLDKHGIDFIDAAGLFDGRPVYIYASHRSEEDRWVVVGRVEGRLIAVVCTFRGEATRLISARRARDGERRKHQALFGG